MIRHFRTLALVIAILALLMMSIYTENVVGLFNGKVAVAHNGAYLGRHVKGNVITHCFEVWNISIRKQQIGLIEPSCTCSIVSVSSYSIRPFSKTKIRMTIDTSKLPLGMLTKGMRITMMDGRVMKPVYISFFLEKQSGRHSRGHER